MSDLIDREYAIKRFCEDGTYLERHGVGMMTLCEAKQRAVDLIESFPSAQPHWIPCSERLPEEDEDVLVCSEEGDIDIACWLPEQWTDEPHIEWWSGEYRVYAVAWMPLPTPYEGENE